MNEIDARLRPLVDRAFADARDAGRMEPVEAYGADAVRDLLLGSTGAAAPRTEGGRQDFRPEEKVIALVDVQALNRGRVEGDATWAVAGVGPVPASTVPRPLSEASLTPVLPKGPHPPTLTPLAIMRHPP